MPTIQIDENTFETLKALASAGLTFNAADAPGCSHWVVDSSHGQIACACDPGSLQGLIQALVEVATAAGESGVSLATQPGVEEFGSSSSTVPTPAQIRSQPLTYTPPAYLTNEPEEAHPRITPAALKKLEDLGFIFEDVLGVLEDPLEVTPTHQWRSIYQGHQFNVVYSESTKTILAIQPPRQPRSTSGIPRVPGQKKDKRSPLPVDSESVVKVLKEKGFDVKHGGKHWKISHDSFPGVFASMPYSPSDFRWVLNFVSEIRAKFGVDLRF